MAELFQVVGLDLPEKLLKAAKAAGLSQRKAFALAVGTKLPSLLRQLKKLRLVAPEEPIKRKPRKIDPGIWAALGSAADELDVSRPALLRCCLRQLLLPNER